MAAGLRRFWLTGWGFDSLYDRLVVLPYLGAAHLLRGDPFDGISSTLGRVTATANSVVSRTQDGRIRTYAFGIGLGAVIAVVNCYQGLARPLNIDDVPEATARAVVQSLTACVVLDALFLVGYVFV